MRKKYNQNNYPHGITFHHFHDDLKHKSSQGSINANTFKKIINFIGRSNIIDCNNFYEKILDNKIEQRNVCLTFDDGCKSQIDVALNVLNDFKIKAFFFIPSSIFSKNPDFLEVYRYFRNNYFKDIDEFYQKFFLEISGDYEKFISLNKKRIKKTLSNFKFFSINDVKFRLIRDNFLSEKEYKQIMIRLFKEKKFNPLMHHSKLFMNQKDLKNIFSEGHLVGLHSDTHPTKIEKLSKQKQFKEFSLNQKKLSHLLKIRKDKILTMSHPCGSYDKNTINVLKKLGIKLGFKNEMHNTKKIKKNNVMSKVLEIPRNDHSILLRSLKNN